jgi:hypothetical protein
MISQPMKPTKELTMTKKNALPTLTGKTVELARLNGEAKQLEEQAGMFGRLLAGKSTQRSAGAALAEIRQHEISALKEVRLTAIALTKSTVKAAMVAETMPALGTLTTQLSLATGNVDQALTNGAAVETYTHFVNRQQNLDLITELRANGKISDEEANLLTQQIQADSYVDIERTRERTSAAKETVAAIHSYGVDTIKHAKDAL